MYVSPCVPCTPCSVATCAADLTQQGVQGIYGRTPRMAWRRIAMPPTSNAPPTAPAVPPGMDTAQEAAAPEPTYGPPGGGYRSPKAIARHKEMQRQQQAEHLRERARPPHRAAGATGRRQGRADVVTSLDTVTLDAI